MGIQTYKIELPQKEILQLQTLIHKGSVNVRTVTRARVLLMAHDGNIDKDIYEPLSLAVSTPYDIRKRYHEGGLSRALYDAPRPGQKPKLNGIQKAQVIALACTKAPKGYSTWTLDLLTEKVKKQLDVSIGRTAIWKILLKSDTHPWREKNVVYTHHYA